MTKIEQDEDRVLVNFESKPPRDFEMVIGADGLHSVIRQLVFGKDHRFEKYLGYMVAAFAANGYRPRDEDVYVSVPANKWRASRMRDDRTMFLLVFADHQGRQIDPQDTNAHKDRAGSTWYRSEPYPFGSFRRARHSASSYKREKNYDGDLKPPPGISATDAFRLSSTDH